VRKVLGLFAGYVPSAKTIQEAVLGFGSLGGQVLAGGWNLYRVQFRCVGADWA
jgi:hypothetical protein